MAFFKDNLSVKQNEFELAPGRILISVPYYNDTFFNRSVVLLTDYEDEHVAGLILNHRLPYPVSQLVDGLRVEAPMYLGGPVLPTALFLLHSFESCKDSSQVAPGIYVGYDQVLLALIEHRAIPNLQYRFLMGYAGWSPGQLEGEIARNMWVIGNPTPELVFHTEPEKMWAKSVQVSGDGYQHWLNVPEYITLD